MISLQYCARVEKCVLGARGANSNQPLVPLRYDPRITTERQLIYFAWLTRILERI